MAIMNHARFLMRLQSSIPALAGLNPDEQDNPTQLLGKFVEFYEEFGIPLFRLGLDQEIAFSCTDCSAIGDVPFPFGAFAVQSPSHYIAAFVRFGQFEIAMSDADGELFGFGIGFHNEPSGEDIIRRIARGDNAGPRAGILSFETAARIVISMSAWISENGAGSMRVEHTHKKRGKRRPSASRAFEVWEPGREIKLPQSMRHAVRSGGPLFSISSRFLVRGHWRNQVCGPKRSQRRRRWIAPHWKGPEEGKRLMRAYGIDG